MISISNDFKKAIKNRNREVKGYVEVLYDYKQMNASLGGSGIQLDPAPIVDDEDVINGNRLKTNYASLEENYFKLDGTFILPNNPNVYNNTNTGYISDKLESNYENMYFRIAGIENNNIKNMTIYYKDNIPNNVKIEIRYLPDLNNPNNIETIIKEINDNNDEFVHFEFEEISNIAFINIYSNEFQYETRRIRIPKIEFGITGIYRGNDLINFKIIEQISEFNVETPIDECDVTLDNYENQFDIMNPSGLAKYLDEDVQIIPYIGIITERNGIEYVKMGVYYLDNYVNNNDKTTTLNCKKIFNKLSKKNSYMRGSVGLWSSKSYFNSLCNENGIENYTYNLNTSNNYVVDYLLELCSALEHFNKFSGFVNGIIRCGRNDDVICENINSVINDSLTLNDMKNFPTYTIKEQLKNIIIKIMSRRLYSSQSSVVCNKTVTVSPENRFIVEFSQGSGSEVEFTPEHFIQDYNLNNYFFDSANMNGTYNIKITLGGSINYDYENKQFNINDIGKEITIQNPYFNNELLDELTFNEAVENTANYIKDNYNKYDVKIDYFGNPCYEPNDVLEIETQYGNKEIRILKHTLTFDGSLSGNIEGVGD